MKTIGIIGALKEEIEFFRKDLVRQNPFLPKFGDIEFFDGFLKDKPVVVVKSGIGKVNAAMVASVLLRSYDVGLVINSGVAGAFPPLDVGDLVVASGLIQYDVDVTGIQGFEQGQVPGFPRIFPTAKYNFQGEPKRGIFGSGDSFVCTDSKIEYIKEHFAEVSVVDMEGAAIAQVCHVFSVPFVAVRCISDVVGSSSPVSFAEFLPVAAEKSASFVKSFLQTL